MAIAVGLFVIGYAGTFFGNLIKAAVSRQREFLADASAVQFTRNPNGIADALRRIGGFSKHALITSPKASEASHMLFGEGISRWTGLFATHPPLRERILRILPLWDGEFIKAAKSATETAAVGAPGVAGLAGAAPALQVASKRRSQGKPGSAPTGRQGYQAALDQIGQPSEAHLAYAAKLVEGLPAAVREAAHEAYGARAVIYALLINRDPAARKRQLDRVQAEADPGVRALTRKLVPEVEQLSAAVRLPLVDMTIPALRGLTLDQYRVFVRNVDHLVRADERIDLFEWTLRRILVRHVTNQFDKVKSPRVHYYGLKRLQNHCEVLLSTLSYVGHKDGEAARRAFAKGAAVLDLSGMALRPAGECGLDAVGQALDVLVATAPKLKRQLLAACGACIGADREVTVEEAEVFRAIGDSLDCPVPPLLPGQPLV